MRRPPASHCTSLRNVRCIRVARILVALAGLTTGAVSEAQNSNFTTPGASNRSAGLPDQESLEGRINEAPWSLGILRFSPWIGIRDASNVSGTNVGDGSGQTDDFTITAGAGLRAYIRSGPRVVIAGHVLPEYTWWADDDNRRRLNGRYGLAVLGYFNRLELELSHRLLEEQSFFSSEVRRLTSIRNEITRGIFNFEISSRVFASLRATRTTADSLEDEGALAGFLSQLDRTEDTLQALVGYRAPNGWRFGIGYQDTSVSFATNARPLSNDVTAVLVEAGFAGNRFNGILELAFRDLEPGNQSVVRAASEVTGVLEGIWELSGRSALLTYVHRSLSYSITGGTSYFIGDRFGARLQTAFNRVGLGLWAETGEDRFESLANAFFDRSDDVTSFGAEATIALKAVRLSLKVRSSDYSSPDSAFDRDVTTFGFSFQIEPLERLLRSATERLRIGDAGATW